MSDNCWTSPDTKGRRLRSSLDNIVPVSESQDATTILSGTGMQGSWLQSYRRSMHKWILRGMHYDISEDVTRFQYYLTGVIQPLKNIDYILFPIVVPVEMER